MIQNYFKIALRNLSNNKIYAAINIAGLATGLAACLLITLYVQDEFSFDRFNEKADRVYRVDCEIKLGDNHMNIATSAAPVGEAMLREIPQVEQFARIGWYGGFLVKKGDQNIREDRVAWADSTLFDVFTLPMIAGNPKTALNEPNSVVLTESIAKKYFDGTDIIGKTLVVNDKENRKVTGVIHDLPLNCHFQFDLFLPYIDNPEAARTDWAGGQNFSTYILLRPGADLKTVRKQAQKLTDKYIEVDLQAYIKKSLAEFTAGGDFFRTSLMPLPDIHLHSNKTAELYGSGDIQIVYIFSAIALLILLIACVNFMNLSTARSANRAREVGVRKVLGSARSHLIRQFLLESMLISIISMVLSLGITRLALPAFNRLAGKDFDESILFSPTVLGAMVVLMLTVGFLAGSYPAFYLSAFQPIKVLKGKLAEGLKHSIMRNSLVVFQFTASVALIIGTVVIYQQLDYILKKDVGYDRNQVLIVNNTSALGTQAATFKEEVKRLSGVQNATLSGFLPVNYYRGNDTYSPSPDMDVKKAISMQNWQVDEDYVSTLDMKLVQGRNFSPEFGTDSMALILNETALAFLGGGDVVGKKLYRFENAETKK